jgi:hypothetical protein
MDFLEQYLNRANEIIGDRTKEEERYDKEVETVGDVHEIITFVTAWSLKRAECVKNNKKSVGGRTKGSRCIQGKRAL